MGNRCVNYVANERLCDEFLAQIEILSVGIEAYAFDGGVCFHTGGLDITLFECDFCEIRCNCKLRIMDAEKGREGK